MFAKPYKDWKQSITDIAWPLRDGLYVSCKRTVQNLPTHSQSAKRLVCIKATYAARMMRTHCTQVLYVICRWARLKSG